MKRLLNNLFSNVVTSTFSDVLKADSGASKTYIKENHRKYLQHQVILKNGPRATLPNNQTIQATISGQLPLHPTLKHQTLLFPELQSETLVSIGKLCDEGNIALFDDKSLKVYKKDENTQHLIKTLKEDNIILKGHRNLKDGLYDVPFTQMKNNYIIHKDKSKLELAQYLHACAFSPVLSTFQASINKGNFLTWPGIEDVKFKKLLGTTLSTALGQLDQERSNLQSTKIQEEQQDSFPDKIPQKTTDGFYKIVDIPENTTTYTDQTGRFPCQSTRGNNYFFVCYNYDSNAILVHPIKNRETESIIEAWEKCHSRLTGNGHITKRYVLDNECSAKFKDTLQHHEINFELVPPHQHRRNAAERAIRTFKNHFLAGLATCDPDFPLREWDRLTTQAELTLNLLRNSRVNPNLSAWAYLFGNHDFNKVPLAPPGTKVVLHSKPNNRKSWALHGEQGWYIGPAFQHYRCISVYIPKTRAERFTDTATLIPKMIPIPNANIEDHLRRTADDLLHVLQGKKHVIPTLQPSSVQGALIKIAQLLHRDETPSFPLLPQENLVSSEGEGKTVVPLPTEVTKSTISTDIEKLQDIPRFKTTITPLIPANTEIHSGLYKQQTLPDVPLPQVQHNIQLHVPKKLKKKRIRNKKTR